LINKEISFTYTNQQKLHTWFNEKTNSWRLFFSKDFGEIYTNATYKILNGDPYYFVFNLEDINKINQQYHVTLIHTGDEIDESYNNPIIVENIELIGY
jgi:hypothetical protein